MAPPAPLRIEAIEIRLLRLALAEPFRDELEVDMAYVEERTEAAERIER